MAINPENLAVRPSRVRYRVLAFLSCLAAIQAPVIMMSQNRQETRDRLHSEHDYQINLKAELEIQQLHEKIDHIMVQQWGRLAEIQQIQTDLMNELLKLQKA